MGWIVVAFLALVGFFVIIIDPSGFLGIVWNFLHGFLIFVLALVFGIVTLMVVKYAIIRSFPGRGREKYDERHTRVEYDEDGCIIGYRYFSVVPDDNGGYVLASIGYGAGVDGGTYPGWTKRSDRVPTIWNKSGIYAAKTPDSPILEQYREDGYIKARVRLYGKVVETEYGYRAQYCDILNVMDSKFRWLTRRR